MTANIKNAYLITCPRVDVAEQRITQLLCDIFPQAIERVRSGEHPDILRVPVNSKGRYDVDTVRDEILSFIAKRGYEGGYKAVVLAGAQRLTPEAGNALLKSLEEPPKNTVFILSATDAGALLPTIVSRCECERLLPEADAAARVMVATGADTARSALLCALTGGYAAAAIELNGNEEWFGMRSRVLEICVKLGTAKRYIYAAHVDYLLSLKAGLDDALAVMESWFADIAAVHATGGTRHIKNLDMAGELISQKTCWTSASLCRIIDIVEETRRNIAGAAAAELACERMFITILEEKLR